MKDKYFPEYSVGWRQLCHKDGSFIIGLRSLETEGVCALIAPDIR
jgi:hypothetical protein